MSDPDAAGQLWRQRSRIGQLHGSRCNLDKNVSKSNKKQERRKPNRKKNMDKFKPVLPALNLSKVKIGNVDLVSATVKKESKTVRKSRKFTARNHPENRPAVTDRKRKPRREIVLQAKRSNEKTAPRAPLQPISNRTPSHSKRHRVTASQQHKHDNKTMTAATALKRHTKDLTAFEQSEILDFGHQIYFVGTTKDKIRAMPQTAHNCGFDDENGDYKIVVNDHIQYRYEIISILGKGSFGQVVKVYDHKHKVYRALKLIRNKRRFHHQALVEVKILDFCTQHNGDGSNIIRMEEYFYFRHHLCITFELLSINLYEFIKSNNFRGVSLNLIRRFAVQLLQALSFTKKHKIIHCDLKPENILLQTTSKSDIKLIDFGSSCFDHERVFTYIQSRFYRSPEVILGIPYSASIDMWSFACILAELYQGYPLFPGENEQEQFQCIMEVLGVPPHDVIRESTRKSTFFRGESTPRLIPNSKGRIRRPRTQELSKVLYQPSDPSMRPLFLSFTDFLSSILKWDTSKRLNPEEAMEHHFISQRKRKTRNTQATMKTSLPPLILTSGNKVGNRFHKSISQ